MRFCLDKIEGAILRSDFWMREEENSGTGLRMEFPILYTGIGWLSLYP